ncbi:hypothetical protein BB8028_0004g01210 [Beauveria bassiana]|uniref:Zn(2)-C6 fungal-type domain-containing protein n=1 Tax=Beauveria bassiana TaxID=176275 RepID=A0A2S7YAI6_BEABA|nr:hypothetical protein BB8028_0004g01210 [Beauveria bassiana]
MEPGPAHRRRRPAVACSECRRRKIRCDRGFPCGPCRKSLPALSCIYHSQPRAYAASAPPRSHAAQHQPRPKVNNTHSVDLTRFNLPSFESDAFHGLDQFGIDWQPSWEHQITPPTGHLADAGADYFQSPTFSVIDDSEKKESTNHSRAGQGYPGSSETIDTGSVVSVSHSVGVNPDSGDDRWYQTLARIGRLEYLIRDITRHQLSDEAQLVPILRDLYEAEPDECLRLPPLSGIILKLENQARLQKQQEDKQSRARLSPLLDASSKIHQLLPPRQACKKLVSAYFETFGSVLCILDTTVFTSEFERFWEAIDASRVPSTDHEEAFAHKLLVVIALGSVTCPSSPAAASAEAERARQTSRRNHAIMCVQHTRQWLAQKTARGIRADLDVAQILCLLALARQTQLHTDPWPRRPSMDGTVILTGDHDLARLGMQMGLHREPRTGSMATPAKEAETELRRRLWATMLELSLHQYLDAELPPPLGSDSYDCATPSSNGVEEEPRSYFVPDSLRVPASTVLAALSRTQRLRLRVLEHLYASGASKDIQERQRLAIELSQAFNAQVNSLLSPPSTQPTSFQLWLLNVLVRPFILALGVPLSGESRNRFADYYLRRLRLENAAAMLRPGPHEDGPRSIQSQIPSHAGQTGSRTKTAATAYPFLPTPGTAEPCNTGSEQHFGTHKAACTSLYISGPSYYAVVHRQVVASLCADVVAEIEDDMFPNLDAAMLHRIVAILEDVVNEYRDQVHASAGAHACHEFILFAAAHSLALASLNRSSAREVKESVMSSVWMALHHCCQAMGEPAEAILETEWGTEAVQQTATATESQPVNRSVSDADKGYETDAQLQGVKYMLQQQGDAVSTADGEIADMWAFDDDESYFSVGLPL